MAISFAANFPKLYGGYLFALGWTDREGVERNYAWVACSISIVAETRDRILSWFS